MNPQNQNNTDPNFDFILNQNGSQKPKKKANKKVVALIILVVLTLMFLIAGLIINKTQDLAPKQTGGTDTSDFVEQESASEESQLIKEFLGYVEQEAYDEAMALLTITSVMIKQAIKNQAFPQLSDFNLQACEFSQTFQNESGKQQTDVLCADKNSDTPTNKLIFVTESTDEGLRIAHFQLVGSEQ